METYDALCALAAWALNGEQDGSSAQVAPFDGALHITAEGEPAAVLTMVNRFSSPRPNMDFRRRTLADIRGALDRLGVRNGNNPPAG